MERTPEEIKAGLECCIFDDPVRCGECPYMAEGPSCSKKVLADVSAQLDKVPKWISVEERLPDREGEYLAIVQLPDGKKERIWDVFHPYKGWCEDSGDGKIVCWMSFDSLPEPPKEG